MEYRKFAQGYVLRLDPGEEIVEKLTELVEHENVQLGSVTALGAVNDVNIGIYSLAEKKFMGRHLQGEYEVSALVGNVTRQDGKPYLHLHITVGNPAAGEAWAGHLKSAVVSATAEIFLQVWDGSVGRRFDSEVTGLNLLDFQ